jgi:hypothetical protein
MTAMSEERLKAFIHWHLERPEIQDPDSHAMALDIKAALESRDARIEELEAEVRSLYEDLAGASGDSNEKL